MTVAATPSEGPGGNGNREPATLTIEETAAILRIGRNQAYEAAKRGEIPSIKIGRRILVSRQALDQLLQGR